MKRARRRLGALCAAGAILLLAAGPGAETTGVENLLLIRTVGVDGTTVTADTGAGQEGQSPVTLTGTGGSVSAAVRAMQYNGTGACPFFSHTEHIVLGAETLESDLRPSLDWMLRSMEIRLDTLLWCVREGNAGEMLETCAGEEEGLSELLQLLGDYAAPAGAGRTFTVGEVIQGLLEQGYALIPALKQGDTPTPAGYAVIGEEGLLGYLDADCAMGVALLTDEWEPQPLYLEQSGVTLLMTGGHTRVKESETGPTVVLSARCSVLQTDAGMDLASEDVRKGILREGEAMLKSAAERAMNALGALGAASGDGGAEAEITLMRTYDRTPAGGI